MEIKAQFANGRCYFGDFNKDIDVNPTTQRSGLNFFRFNTIGFLLSKLGLANKVHYVEEKPGAKSKRGVVYLHPKSFKLWKENHSADVGLNIQQVNQAIFNKNIEKAIKLICDNFTNRKVTNQQLREKAENQFKDHPNKNLILKMISFELERYTGEDTITLGRLYLSSSEEEKTINNEIASFFRQKDLFPNVVSIFFHE